MESNIELEYPSFEELSHVVGLKETARAIEKGIANLVYLASDCDPKFITRIKDLTKDFKVKLVMVSSMETLGLMAGLKVGASAACILK